MGGRRGGAEMIRCGLAVGAEEEEEEEEEEGVEVMFSNSQLETRRRGNEW